MDGEMAFTPSVQEEQERDGMGIPQDTPRTFAPSTHKWDGVRQGVVVRNVKCPGLTLWYIYTVESLDATFDIHILFLDSVRKCLSNSSDCSQHIQGVIIHLRNMWEREIRYLFVSLSKQIIVCKARTGYIDGGSRDASHPAWSSASTSLAPQPPISPSGRHRCALSSCHLYLPRWLSHSCALLCPPGHLARLNNNPLPLPSDNAPVVFW